MLHLFPDVLTIEASGLELRAQPEWRGEIMIHGDQAVISLQDILLRKLPNGRVERYAVLDVAYQHHHGALPAMTTVKIQRADSVHQGGRHITQRSARRRHWPFLVTRSPSASASLRHT